MFLNNSPDIMRSIFIHREIVKLMVADTSFTKLYFLLKSQILPLATNAVSCFP